MRLVVITDWRVPDCLARATAAAAVDPRVAIQHRHHGASRTRFAEDARRLRAACPTLFINSDAALARELACGLHLPEHLPTPDFAGPITRALHGPIAAPEPDVTYLLSPVFSPRSKAAERPPLGVAGFRALAATLPAGRAFALGGLTAEALTQLRPLAGAAVIGAVMHAEDAARATEALLRALE